MKKSRRPRRLVVDVPENIEDLIIVHPSGRVHRFSFGHLVDDVNEDLTEATEDKAHRIRYPIPTIRKTLRFTPPAGVGTVDLMGSTISYGPEGKRATRELIHSEDLTDDESGDRLVVDVVGELSTVIMERDGFPFRHINFEDEETEDPDPFGRHGFISQIDIPHDCDMVRVDYGPGGGPDDTFAVIQPPEDKAKAGGKNEADGAVELVISNLAGGQTYYRLEFAHPDGEHFTEVDRSDGEPPRTYRQTFVRNEGPVEKPARKPKMRRAKEPKEPKEPPPEA